MFLNKIKNLIKIYIIINLNNYQIIINNNLILLMSEEEFDNGLEKECDNELEEDFDYMLEEEFNHGLEEKFKTLMTDFKISIEKPNQTKKRKCENCENDVKTNEIPESANRIPWGKDELMYFVKILFYYIVYKKENKPGSLIDENFFDYYSTHESLVSNNNHRTITQLRDKFNHMKDNWHNNKKWITSGKFDDIETYIFSRLQDVLIDKNLWDLRKARSINEENKNHNVRKKILNLFLYKLVI
jgi:hypothetical protein